MAMLLAAVSLRADDVYVRREGQAFTIGSAMVERTVVLRDGRLLLTSFKDKRTGRDLLAGSGGVADFSVLLGAEHTPVDGASGSWKLVDVKEARQAQHELRLDLTIEREPLRITRSYVLFPGSSIVREATTIANVGKAPIIVSDPGFISMAAAVGKTEAIDFHWITGAHNVPGLWNLKTEKLPAGAARTFDSYDAPPHGKPGPREFRPGSASYAPWYALYGRETRQGVFIGFDYFGHWTSSIQTQPDSAVGVQIRLAGFRRELKPGASITTPWALAGLFHDDLDNAGNELLDWQYAYLWDYTRDGRNGTYPWFPALRTLGYWAKGTGWGKPGTGWTGGNPDWPSCYRKIFRVADYMRSTGTDVYHRDWGWWDIAGDWNGPDFRSTGEYLRKSSMGQLIYAFVYTVSRKSRVAKEHPEWLARSDDDGVTLDMSMPEVVHYVQDQLDSFVARWGNFEWRNDSTLTGERPGDPSTLLEQDQNFRGILRTFLDKYPNCAFQAVNGGGNFAGYDYLRYASNVQFSDGEIGLLRNQWSSLLFPPDKNCDNPDQWNPDHYDKARWRGLLCFNYDTTGDTINPAKLEGIRELNDIYHYLLTQGVVGRWVRVYRPIVAGDDPTMWFQRLSRDGKRGIIIPKHRPAGPVTVHPKGLLPGETYTVSFHETDVVEKRAGAELMERGITLAKMPAGELIYLNLPLHPGSKIDKTPPAPPTPVELKAAENMGYPGVELAWKPGTDDNWVSYYQVFRNGDAIDKVAKGTYYFDHSVGADVHARYELATVDGAGNDSPRVAFTPAAGRPATILDDAESKGMTFSGNWSRLSQPPAYGGTLSLSKEKGASAGFEVEGKRVLLFSKLGADCGKVAVSIDGEAAEVVDTFSADDIWGVCIWRHKFPVAGKHTVRLTVLGEHGSLSSGNTIYIDGVCVEQE